MAHPNPPPVSGPELPARVDVLVVGGGVNGCGIARDLAGRGLSVLLAERDDLAAHTSSASTKLVHGGLRYLEHREFALVRKSLHERDRLLRSAPHLMWPLRFVIPHLPDARPRRPAWLLGLGLWLYDHLAPGDVLPRSRRLALARDPAGAGLQAGLDTGFAYWDGRVDDARLVLALAQDAVARGAQVRTRLACTGARRTAAGWDLALTPTDGASPAPQAVQARLVVNAAGPWAAQWLRDHARGVAGQAFAPRRLRLVQGSHIVVPRLAGTGDDAYLLPQPDGRIVFVLPYEGAFSMIGTTDVELTGEPAPAAPTRAEIDYLCAAANARLRARITPADVVWAWAGVRPLLDDEHGNPAAVTRDWRLEMDAADGGAPLLNVWGGKLTTFRRLAEEAGDAVARQLGLPRPAWTADAVLPGGDLSPWTGRPARSARLLDDLQDFVRALAAQHPWLPAPVLQRWARAYGADITRLLEGAQGVADLGPEVAPGVHLREIAHGVRHEWVRTGEDFLWRRSKLGLHLDAAGQAAVEAAVAVCVAQQAARG